MEPQSIHNGSTSHQNPAANDPDVSLPAKDQIPPYFKPLPPDDALNTSLSAPAPVQRAKTNTEQTLSPAEETQSRPITEVIGEKVKTWWNSLRPFDQRMGAAWTGLAFLEANIALMHPVGSTPFIAHTCLCAADSLLAAIHFLRTKGAARGKE